VSAIGLERRGRVASLTGELAKVPAFVRRDWLVLLSYRVAFVSDIVGLLGQVLVFAFVSKMIEPSALPRYGGTEVTYLEFACVGIVLATFIQFGLNRVSAAVRGEQLMGTLESVLATPTTPSTIQLGSVAFDLLYIPLRTAVFLGGLALAFGLHLQLDGILPAIVILIVFMPFVWGLGVASAGLIMTFRRGSGLIGTALVGLGLFSGIYFPITLLPEWAERVAMLNPITHAIDGMRDALLGGTGWSEVPQTVAIVFPFSVFAFATGLLVFRAAVHRERRLGSLGVY
jgi:ABC-2 type transport system permease protein